MTRQHRCLVRQGQNLFLDPAYQQFVVASRQVGPPNTSGKENIAAEQDVMLRRVEAKAARTMAGNKKNAKRDSAKVGFGSLLNQEIRLNRFCFQKKPEVFEEIRVRNERNSIWMISNQAPGSSFNFRSVIHMIDVAVGD